jgi:hypothetical protein
MSGPARESADKAATYCHQKLSTLTVDSSQDKPILTRLERVIVRPMHGQDSACWATSWSARATFIQAWARRDGGCDRPAPDDLVPGGFQSARCFVLGVLFAHQLDRLGPIRLADCERWAFSCLKTSKSKG